MMNTRTEFKNRGTQCEDEPDLEKGLVDYDSDSSTESSSSDSTYIESSTSSSSSSSSSSTEFKLEDEVERKEAVIRAKDRKATRLINIIRDKNSEIERLQKRDLDRQREGWKLLADMRRQRDAYIQLYQDSVNQSSVTEQKLNDITVERDNAIMNYQYCYNLLNFRDSSINQPSSLYYNDPYLYSAQMNENTVPPQQDIDNNTIPNYNNSLYGDPLQYINNNYINYWDETLINNDQTDSNLCE